jgi:preprotein translocase subunit SecA
MDIQRREVYGLRQDVLEGNDVRLRAVIEDMIGAVVDRHVDEAYGKGVHPSERDPEALTAWFRRHFAMDADPADVGTDAAEAKEVLGRIAADRWRRREEELGVLDMRRLERFLLLDKIDAKWKDHLRAMDGLRTGVGLRGYGQLDPKVEYKVEGHAMFSEMIRGIREEVTDLLFKVRLRSEDEAHLADRWGGAEAPPPPPAPEDGAAQRAPAALPVSSATAGDVRAFRDAREGRPVGSEGAARAPIRRDEPKVGRNDPCPCGSGRKYKKCHGTSA